MKKCAQCGAENQDGARFCGMCRFQLSEISPKHVRFQSSHILMAIGGVVLALVVYLLMSGPKPTKASTASMSTAQLDKYGDSAFSSKDYSTSMKWYELAAERGDPTAENFMGWFYQKGLGVGADQDEAVKWYLKAAAQGNAPAQTNVGWCYQNALGVSRNYAQAMEWYKKAIAQGNASAEINMGYLYENGIGVARNYSEAQKWYQMAARQGNQEAQRDLEMLSAKQVNLKALLHDQ